MNDHPHIPSTGLTRPLNLGATTEAPRFRVDAVPFIDLFALSLFFIFLSGKLVFSPGIALDLPSSTLSEIAGYRTDAVLTVLDDGFILDGGIYPPDRLPEILNRTATRIDASDASILVKVAANTPVETFTKIAETCRAAGFGRVIVAVEESP